MTDFGDLHCVICGEIGNRGCPTCKQWFCVDHTRLPFRWMYRPRCGCGAVYFWSREVGLHLRSGVKDGRDWAWCMIHGGHQWVDAGPALYVGGDDGPEVVDEGLVCDRCDRLAWKG